METLWPLALQLSVSAPADGRSLTGGGATEAGQLTEVSAVTVVETLWPLPLQLSVSEDAG